MTASEQAKQSSPYSRFEHKELVLTDHLAVDRTVLAIERTVLGYVRTTLALVAAGASLIHFFDHLGVRAAGVALIAVGVPLFGWGLWRAWVRHRALKILTR